MYGVQEWIRLGSDIVECPDWKAPDQAMSFRTWMKSVERHVELAIGFGLDMLEDEDYADSYEAGVRTVEMARKIIARYV